MGEYCYLYSGDCQTPIAWELVLSEDSSVKTCGRHLLPTEEWLTKRGHTFTRQSWPEVGA